MNIDTYPQIKGAMSHLAPDSLLQKEQKLK